MSTNDNKALVARFYEAFNTENADTFRAILSPAWCDHPEAPDQLPGPEGLIGVVGTFRKAFEGLHITPEQVVAEANHVVVRIRLEGHHVKDFNGHAPSGKHAVFQGMDMHRIENGAIAETWHFEDFSSLAK